MTWDMAKDRRVQFYNEFIEAWGLYTLAYDKW
ncbi:Unannotated [Lentimonas sp. CC19]|nr:Unannotated [Lentimonas sp. CC10]CAA6697610.1 Unannotated [Lentimonas sp. CC19]CAA7070480.1 Unannotated [Lentimonas sp. CC11]